MRGTILCIQICEKPMTHNTIIKLILVLDILITLSNEATKIFLQPKYEKICEDNHYYFGVNLG